MPELPATGSQVRLTKIQWLVCIIASIGFAFDIYELLMLPLIAPDALKEFGIKPGSPEFTKWIAILFYVPAVAGGLVGLWGGYLTDLLGRRRVLTWSILCYAISAFLAGFSTNIWMLLFFRSTTFIGVCVEFVAAVAWLAELFPDPRRREKVLGYTQAFSSIGGLLVASANSLCLSMEAAARLPAIQIPDALSSVWGQIATDPSASLSWRFTLMSGLIPAIPLLVIRPFLPESPAWQKKKEAGQLKRPSFSELFQPHLRRTTIVTTLMFACSYGAAFGAIQQLRQIVPGLTADVAAMKDKIKHGQEKQAAAHPGDPKFAVAPEPRLVTLAQGKLYSDYNKVQELGGLLGRFAFAFIAVWFVSRRWLLRVFQWPGLLFMPLFFWFLLSMPNTKYFEIPLTWLGIGTLPITNVSLGVALAGFFTVAQFSFWGNYLPLAYPLHLRGTGESFAANIGGRLLGTMFAAVTAWIAGVLTPAATGPPSAAATAQYWAMAAAGVALFVYLSGSIACFWLPEPKATNDDE
ncbi:MAG: MFS transporter [Planctomycetota bacterium]